MIKDLVIAFGNPFLHHPDPVAAVSGDGFRTGAPAARRCVRHLHAAGEPTRVPRWRRCQSRRRAADRPRRRPTRSMSCCSRAGRCRGSRAGATGVDVGGRMLADLNGDGIYDVGDGIVVNLSEPFTDTNGNGVFDDRRAVRRCPVSMAWPAPATTVRTTAASTTTPIGRTGWPRIR